MKLGNPQVSGFWGLHVKTCRELREMSPPLDRRCGRPRQTTGCRVRVESLTRRASLTSSVVGVVAQPPRATAPSANPNSRFENPDVTLRILSHPC
jgi:hypothetical protein